MSRHLSSPTSVRPVHTGDVRRHLRLVDAPPARPSERSLVVEQLDAWTLAPATSLSPTTICWVEPTPARAAA